MTVKHKWLRTGVLKSGESAEIPNLLTNCGAWSKLLKLSEPQFFHNYDGFLSNKYLTE